MKILVTGSKGFIGKNLVSEFKSKKYSELAIYEFDKSNSLSDLETYCSDCDFVIHLAGVNRPKNNSDFVTGNYELTKTILNFLKKHNNKCPILVASSIQAVNDSEYGKSKKMMEDLLNEYKQEEKNKILIYRLPNVFGKWCKPSYNSVVATFAHNIANDLEITINDKGKELNLVYVGDVVKEFINAIYQKENKKGDYCYVEPVFNTTVGEVAQILYDCKNVRSSLDVPSATNMLKKYMYATYLSYVPLDQMAYELTSHEDSRGTFTEIIKTLDAGQFSINVTHPNVIKGNHFHQTKHEKFLVVQGEAEILLRKIGESTIYKYKVDGKKLMIVDIPVGYTHCIKNIGQQELITFMWASEPFDENKPDTIFEEVILHE